MAGWRHVDMVRRQSRLISLMDHSIGCLQVLGECRQVKQWGLESILRQIFPDCRQALRICGELNGQVLELFGSRRDEFRQIDRLEKTGCYSASKRLTEACENRQARP